MIEDHPSVYDGVGSVLPNDRYEFLPIQRTVREGLDYAMDNEIHLLILDLTLPKANGESLIAPFQDLKPCCPILVFSGTHDLSLPERCIRSGARGFVRKSSPTQIFLKAVEHLLYRKSRYLDPDLVRFLETTFTENSAFRLTPKEASVTRYIAQGMSNNAIAKRLKVSSHTVNTHRRNVMKKIGARTVCDVVLFAVETGLVDTTDRSSEIKNGL